VSAYLGKWQLLAELSHYDQGEPPESGTYLIEEKGGEIHFDIHWTAKGQDMNVSFSAPPDGRQVPSDFPGVDSFSVLHEDDHTLSGDALAGGRQISIAIRRVSNDGQLMSVLQDNPDPAMGRIRTYQVYNRIA